jgi:hypothetical protein
MKKKYLGFHYLGKKPKNFPAQKFEREKREKASERRTTKNVWTTTTERDDPLALPLLLPPKRWIERMHFFFS